MNSGLNIHDNALPGPIYLCIFLAKIQFNFIVSSSPWLLSRWRQFVEQAEIERLKVKLRLDVTVHVKCLMLR